MLLDLATGDAGGPGIFFRTASLLTCASVGAADVAAFLVDTVEGRLRRYILWKRQEVEDSLPEGHAICARYSVPFQVRANEWSRSGYCSRICFRSAMKSRA
ncbi:MAG: hypothetical protein JO332_20610 [Planctomycetaceae bacterium]|nr:hypothetical protein [Planctomycetaceae bacterium]